MNAILFPGQGVQAVGMMDTLFSSSNKAKDLFIKASDTIEIDLIELVTDDSNNLIDLTEYSQPIILASSIALEGLVTVSLRRSIMFPMYWIGKNLKTYNFLF